MSLNFLPLPIYIILCSVMFVLMIYFAITRRKKDRKIQIISYITLSLTAPLMVMSRIFPSFYTQLVLTLYGIALIFFIEITVIGINDYKKGIAKRRIIWGLLLIWPCIIFIILILLHVI